MTRRRHLNAVPAVTPARRALIYLRVSALMGRGGDDFYSPDMQLAAGRRAIDLNQLTEIGVVDDDIDQTGRTFEREGVAKIKKLVEGGHVDALVCYDIKRFGRNVLEGLEFARWLDERGVRIVSASENIDTSTPSGRWMFTQLLAMAEYQSDEIGQYWASVHLRRVQKGHHHSAPLGYIRVDDRMIIDQLKGPAMTRVFERYAKGERLRDITADFCATTGVTTHTEKMKRRLRNHVYLGLAKLNGQTYPGLHEPLVSQEVFDLVQARLELDAGLPPRQIECSWALTGLLVCGASERGCGIVQHGRSHDGDVVRLKCAESRRGRLKRCTGVGKPGKLAVERAVLEQVAQHVALLRDDLGAWVEAAARRASAASEIPALRAQQTRARNAMSKLTKEWALGEVPDHAYREALAELTEAELAASRALVVAEQATSVARTPKEIVSAGEALLSMWGDMTEPERARALRLVVERVVIRRGVSRREPIADRVDVQFL